MSGQSDTDSCEDIALPTAEEQAVQSIMDHNDMSYSSIPKASPSKSPVKTFKIINGKLVKNDPKSSTKHVPGSKYSNAKLESLPKKQTFVLKDGECTRTCSTVLYYSSRSDPAAMDSPFGEESKENDNPDDPEDQISVEDMDLANIKIEPTNNESEFESHYENVCNMEYDDQGQVEYYVQANCEFAAQEDVVMEPATDECVIETELVFDSEYVEEVGANIELSTEEIAPVHSETISCDICDEIFEDRKELMKHIQTMHIG